MKKKMENLVKFTDLPDNLKKEATKKALKIGYRGKEITRLFFNVENDRLSEGVIDKGFKF